MAHIDRQPTDEVFNDIVNAAQNMWIFHSDLHDLYIEEQITRITNTENYADNWAGIIQRMDSKNQVLFLYCIKLQATMDFLREQHVHYSYAIPRVLV